MSDEFITSGEFSRWRADFQGFQERLDERLDSGFDGMNHRLDELNGRTRRNSEAIIALDSRVENIRHSGCARLASHQKARALGAAAPTSWHKDKRIWFGVGGGASVIAVLYEAAQALHAYLDKVTP